MLCDLSDKNVMPMSKLIYTLSQANEAFFEAIGRIEDMDDKIKTVIIVGTLFVLGAEFSTKIEMLVDLCAGLIKHPIRTSQCLKVMKDLPRNIPYIFVEYLVRKDKHHLLRTLVSTSHVQLGEHVAHSNTTFCPSSGGSFELQFAIAYLIHQYEKKRQKQNSYQLVFENCLSELPSFGMSEEQKRSKSGFKQASSCR